MTDEGQQGEKRRFTRVELTFGQLEATLADAYNIAGHKRVAFGGRLKALLKHGLPRRARPGRGRAASYTFAEAFQITLGLEINGYGIPPQIAAKVVRTNWPRLCRSINYFVRSSWSQTNKMTPDDLLWKMYPTNLSELTPVEDVNDDLLFAIEIVNRLAPTNGIQAFWPNTYASGFTHIAIEPQAILNLLLYGLSKMRFSDPGGGFEDLRADELKYYDETFARTGLRPPQNAVPPWSAEADSYFQGALGTDYLAAQAARILKVISPAELEHLSTLAKAATIGEDDAISEVGLRLGDLHLLLSNFESAIVSPLGHEVLSLEEKRHSEKANVSS